MDLNEFFIRSPHSTFFVWVDNSEIEGIERGDLLIVNRARKRRDGDIAVIYNEGDYCLRRLERRGEYWFLLTDKTGLREMAEAETICWGIVDAIIRRCWS